MNIKGTEIQSLKAQVTSLREALEVIAGEKSHECQGLSLIAQIALDMTQEQCTLGVLNKGFLKVSWPAVRDSTVNGAA